MTLFLNAKTSFPQRGPVACVESHPEWGDRRSEEEEKVQSSTRTTDDGFVGSVNLLNRNAHGS